MALATYDDLKSAIANWLARDDLTSYVDDFIVLAESRHKQDLLLQNMVTSVSAALSATRFYNLPTDYLGVSSLHLAYTEFKRLRYASPEQMLVYYKSASGKPDFFTIRGDQFELNQTPDSTNSYTLFYYAAMTALSDANATNWLLTNAPGTYLFGALAESAPFIGDDARVAVWEGKYKQLVAGVITRNSRETYPTGQPLVTRTDTYNP